LNKSLKEICNRQKDIPGLIYKIILDYNSAVFLVAGIGSQNFRRIYLCLAVIGSF